MSHKEMLMEVQWNNNNGIVPLTTVEIYLSFVYFIGLNYLRVSYIYI